MHVPDGFIDGHTSVAAAAVATAGTAFALRRAAARLDQDRIALAGVTAACIFAAQMVNFPVASGTSGHLLGGALAAVLVGPWLAMVCLTVVVLVQALVFADGGLSALGVNVVLLAQVGVLVGYGAVLLSHRALCSARRTLPVAAAMGAWAGVLGASLAFVAIYAIGGTAPVSLSALATSMLGVHALIGVGEATITGLVVGALVATRPDLVALAGEAPEPRQVPVPVGGPAS